MIKDDSGQGRDQFDQPYYHRRIHRPKPLSAYRALAWIILVSGALMIGACTALACWW